MCIYGWLKEFLPTFFILFTVNSYCCTQTSVNTFGTSVYAWAVTSCNNVFNSEKFGKLDYFAGNPYCRNTSLNRARSAVYVCLFGTGTARNKF